MRSRQLFAKLPSKWIEDGGLKQFQWTRGRSDETASLMLFIVIVQSADPVSGIVRLTYEEFNSATELSRAKIAAGLEILSQRKLIVRGEHGRSSISLVGHDPDKGWAKLPVRGLYTGATVAAFRNFKLRCKAELDALKLYLLFAARRDRSLNMAPISYEKIEDYSGVKQAAIKPALNILAANALVHIERFASHRAGGGIAHAYRLAHLDSYRHLGTRGRDDGFDFGITGQQTPF
jgi:hypothetical protein